MNDEQLLWLWGKTARNDKGEQRPDVYHPLLFHLLDVGHVARLLWEEALPERTQIVLSSALGLEVSTACRLITWLAAAHDIGKACPGFQFQKYASSFGPQFLWRHLEAAGLQDNSAKSEPHGFVSARVLKPLLNDGAAKILSHITGAHHGTFPQSSDLRFEDALGDQAWDDARKALLRPMSLALFGDDEPPPRCGSLLDPALVPVLAGLISVADWIGSSKKHFPAITRENRGSSTTNFICEYNKRSQNQAQMALEEFGWLPRVTFGAERRTFRDLFPFDTLNPLQVKVEELSTRIVREKPFFLIVEAAMGAGKTETALWACDVALCRRAAHGFYLALPTQATSNAMFHRLQRDYLKGRGHKHTDLQLAHGNALLHEKQDLELAPIGDEVGQGANEQARMAAESWFAGRKQTLLAPFGVGTIDQGLMGALQTSHWFVRLFGLAGKVVIFDEVHAYDTYMSTLLEQLLRWLRVLDCSVVLLSATLPRGKRHALLKAWGAKPLAEEKPYPRLTWTQADSGESGEEAESIGIDDTTPPKTVLLNKLKVGQSDSQVLCDELRRVLQHGGCAAVICNTVNRAQEVFSFLRLHLGKLPEIEFHLLHARMPFEWRRKREETILAKFGKKKSPRPECPNGRPRRAILVATQVAEQSLDLDFDWMASEMAPIDLLLQRMGRLHRHEKDENKRPIIRPQGLEIPRFTVLCDAESGENSAPPETFGSYENTVYEGYILLRSWLALRDRTEFRLPRDIETCIKAVYDDPPPSGLSEAWRKALNQAEVDAEHRRRQDRIKAQNVVIGAPDEPECLVDKECLELADDEDPKTHESLRAATRDGDPSISVVCLCRVGDRLFLPDLKGQPNLTQPVDLQQKQTLQQTRDLLKFSLPLSQKSLYFALCKSAVPVGWRKNAHLRFSRELIFQNGKNEVAGRVLHLDPERGLVIEKPKSDTPGTPESSPPK